MKDNLTTDQVDALTHAHMDLIKCRDNLGGLVALSQSFNQVKLDLLGSASASVLALEESFPWLAEPVTIEED